MQLNFLNRFLNPVSLDIGMDLGTANSLIYVKGKGIILNEPSVVAIDQKTKKPFGFGQEAKDMLGRTPQRYKAIRPLKDGVIADLEATEMMISHFLRKACPRNSFIMRTRMVIGVPSGITQVEEHIVYKAAEKVGLGPQDWGQNILVEEPLAAAVGANLPILTPKGNMIVDIGGGTTEVAVISMGQIVVSESLSIAGDEMNDAIIQYMRKVHNLVIGESTAEQVKIQMGAAWQPEEERSTLIKGLHLTTGLPSSVKITSSEVCEALQEPLKAIIECVRRTLENTPPELAGDIIEQGIVLAGGGAMLYGLDKILSIATEVAVHIAEQPLICVARGTGIIVEELAQRQDSKLIQLLEYKTKRR